MSNICDNKMRIIELSSKGSKDGERKIKVILHEIYRIKLNIKCKCNYVTEPVGKYGNKDVLRFIKHNSESTAQNKYCPESF